MSEIELVSWQKKQGDMTAADTMDNYGEDIHRVLPHTGVIFQAAAAVIRSCERQKDKLPPSIQKKLQRLNQLQDEQINVVLLNGLVHVKTGEITPPEEDAATRRRNRRKARRQKK